ncbi:MAG: sensor histidine kinase [Pirellulaceae bacterium]
MRLAIRLSSVLVLGMVAILAIDAYETIQREGEFLRADIQRDTQLLGRSLKGLIVDVWKSSGEKRAMELIGDANRDEDNVHVRWVWLDTPDGDPSGPAVNKHQLDAVTHGAEASFTTEDPQSSGLLVTYVPVLVPNNRPGALELAESFSSLESYRRRTIVRTLRVMAGLMAFGAAGVVWLGTLFVGRPLRQLVQAVRRIGGGDLAGRIEGVRRDEWGELAGALNDMSQQLTEAHASVRQEAEQRIAAFQQLRHAERLSTVGRLAAGIAHEVGTPLNVITARAKQLAVEEPPPADARGHAVTIGRQAERIATIIRQLLGFARSGQGDRKPQDLVEVVAHSVRLLEPLATRQGAELRVIVPQSQMWVSADAQQLEQVITNLVMNALQAISDNGRVEVCVFRSLHDTSPGKEQLDGEYASFSVSDDGAGIAEENLERIFEPFYTTKDVGEGTGLGLSVTHGIVSELGGRIDVQSHPGKGSCFTVFLPMLNNLPDNGGCAAMQVATPITSDAS